MMRVFRKGGVGIALMTGALAMALAVTGCNKDQGSGAAETGKATQPATAGGGGGGADDHGPASIDHGGITEIPTDAKLVEEGKALFGAKTCSACHAMNNKMVGPPLAGITEKRSPQWLAKMIMHPDKMLKEDPTAKALLEEYKSPMSNLNITPDEAKAILAYLGTQK